jgi:hypothetical protein
MFNVSALRSESEPEKKRTGERSTFFKSCFYGARKVASRARRYTRRAFAQFPLRVNLAKCLLGKAPQSPRNAPVRVRLRVLADAFMRGKLPADSTGKNPRVKGQDERAAPALDAAPCPRRFAAKEGTHINAFPPAKTTMLIMKMMEAWGRSFCFLV